MTEYGLCYEAAQMHLDWLADQAARLKAAVAAALHAVADGAAAGTLAAPPGLLLPFPRELLAPPATLSATGRTAAATNQQVRLYGQPLTGNVAGHGAGACGRHTGLSGRAVGQGERGAPGLDGVMQSAVRGSFWSLAMAGT